MKRLASIAILALGLLPACGGGSYLNENDRLREQNLGLAEQVQDLGRQVEDLKIQLQIARRPAAPALPPGIQPAQCVRIEIGRFSAAADTDGDGRNDAVRLYLAPQDANRRFIQVTGRARVSVVAIVPGRDARTLGTRTFEPAAFDGSYRSGITGTHYTLVCPLTEAVPQGVRQLTVRAALDDLVTGQSHEAEHTLRW